MTDTQLALLYTTLPDEASAVAIATALVEARLAACANIYPGMTAVYVWQGATQREREVGMILKTRPALMPVLVAALKERHPYEVPALIELGLATANDGFLAWLEAQTRPIKGNQP